MISIEQWEAENERLQDDCSELRSALQDLKQAVCRLQESLNRAEADVFEAREREQTARIMEGRALQKYAAATRDAAARANLLREQMEAVCAARLEGREEMRAAVVAWLQRQELDALVDRIARLEVHS